MTDLEILRADLVAARLPGHRTRAAILVAAAAATITAAALAANHYLGQPAPAHVKARFAKLINDPRWPVKPVLQETVKALALSPHGVLYGASAKDRTDCLEFVTTGGTTYWVFCANVNRDRGLVLIPPLPFHGTAASPPPYVIVGRMSDRGARIEARTPDGHTEPVPLGLRGYFVFEPGHQTAARSGVLQLVERNRAGGVTDHVTIPPQIVVSTAGIPPRKVTGYVTAPRARYASLFVAPPARDDPTGGGTRLVGSAPIGKDGRFSWTVHHKGLRNWVVSVMLVDSNFVPLSDPQGAVQDALPVPDARFWAKARAEAARG
jgi:hypothetical protein